MSKHRQEFEKAYRSRGIVKSVEEWAVRNNVNVETAVQEHLNVKKALSRNTLSPMEKSVLDVGCGPGFLLERLHQRSNPLLLCGLDISKFELENASINCPSASLVCGCGENLPFRDQIFQSIVCSEVVEHVISPRKTLREITRVLNVNGKVGISTPNPSSLIMRFCQLLAQRGKIRCACKDEPISLPDLISMLPRNLEVCEKTLVNPFPLLPGRGIFRSKLLAKLMIRLSSVIHKVPKLDSRTCRHYVIVARRKC